MKKQELFDRTIGILVKAYFDGYLEAADCAACAVGNLVSANCGYKVICINQYMNSDGEYISPEWTKIRKYCFDPIPMPDRYVDEAKKQVDSTGYSIQQLINIEQVFMNASFGNNFLKLMAVVDYLIIIHEANDVEVLEAKELFTINN